MAIYDRDPTTGELTSLTGESNIKNLTPSATKELTTTATKAHSEGDYFNLNGKFVKAIDDIAIGDMLTEGTNIETTTVGAELTDINEDITTVGNTASSASTNATRALNMARSTSSFPTGDAYSTSSSYSVGDLVIYNNTLYKCKTACSSGSWSSNSSNFKTTSLAGEITNLNSDLSELSTAISNKSNRLMSEAYSKSITITDYPVNFSFTASKPGWTPIMHELNTNYSADTMLNFESISYSSGYFNASGFIKPLTSGSRTNNLLCRVLWLRNS